MNYLQRSKTTRADSCVMSSVSTRQQIISILAEQYFKLLTSLDWSDELMIGGLREGLNKFLSNLHLRIAKSSRFGKYGIADFYSEIALDFLENNHGSLVFEHMVPKRKYIQGPCEKLASANSLTYEFIEASLKKYWWIAVISQEEDRRLNRFAMPESWDDSDVFARYRQADIDIRPRLFEIEVIR